VRSGIDESAGGAVRKAFNLADDRQYEEIDDATWAALRGEEAPELGAAAGGAAPAAATPSPHNAAQATGGRAVHTPKELWALKRAGAASSAPSDAQPGAPPLKSPSQGGQPTSPSTNSPVTPREKWLAKQQRGAASALPGASPGVGAGGSEWDEEEAEWRRMHAEREERLAALREKIQHEKSP